MATRAIAARDDVSCMLGSSIAFLGRPGKISGRCANSYHRPGKFVRYARAKDFRDDGSGMHNCGILFSTAGAGYPAGYAHRYHRAGKFVRNAHAKDTRDSVSVMHERNILLSNSRGNLSGTHAPMAPGTGYPGGTSVGIAAGSVITPVDIAARTTAGIALGDCVTFDMFLMIDVPQRCSCRAHMEQSSLVLRRSLGDWTCLESSLT